MVYYYEWPGQKNNYLMHYGILGMRWGIRRFQNPDGTLTDLGKIKDAADRKRKRKMVMDNIKNITLITMIAGGATAAALYGVPIEALGAGAGLLGAGVALKRHKIKNI